ncbi:Hypothetical protein NTJ_14479 [Nesidiocoris tenuis]|uniref:Gustatory receptor n=1 Tax=Nesidiocoris tenuis TaxID=355587 RepID=A0ABN7BFP9_9HEMI|nr:Hypothetical protein NTJ_14479 [Nesidiocoris tenuis]
MPNQSLIRHLKIFRYFGYLPLKLENRAGEISKPFLSLTIAIFAVMAFSTTYSNLSIATGNIAASALNQLKSLLSNVAPLLFFVHVIRRRGDFGKVTAKLMDLQRALDSTEYPMFWSVKIFSGIMLLMLAIMTIYRVIMVAAELSTPSRLVSELLLPVCLFPLLSVIAQFTYLANCLGVCFKKLRGSDFGKITMTQYLHTYNEIVNLAEEINGIYDLALSTMLLLAFGNVIYTASFSFTAKQLSQIERIRYCSFLVVPVAVIVHILCSCQSVASSAAVCNKALLDFRIHECKRSIEDNLLLLHYSGNRPLSFKASNAVTINYNLGVSMIATFLTYTIVLYQTELENNKN